MVICVTFLQLEKWYKCNPCWWNGPWKDCAICIHSWIFTGNIIKLKRSNLCLFLHILLILITCFRIHNNYMVLSLLSYHFLQSQIGPKNSENGSQIWMWWSMLVIEPVERYPKKLTSIYGRKWLPKWSIILFALKILNPKPKTLNPLHVWWADLGCLLWVQYYLMWFDHVSYRCARNMSSICRKNPVVQWSSLHYWQHMRWCWRTKLFYQKLSGYIWWLMRRIDLKIVKHLYTLHYL